jgi:hypothetical protein
MDSYGRLAGLSVTIDACNLEGLRQVVSQGFERQTTVVRLIGEGVDGAGEDVTYEAVDQLAFQHQPPPEELKGRFSLAEFSAVLSQVRLFPDRPRAPAARHRRRRRVSARRRVAKRNTNDSWLPASPWFRLSAHPTAF